VSTQDAQEELDRLAAAMGKALGTETKGRVYAYTTEEEGAVHAVYLTIGGGGRTVETAVHPTLDTAVAELRAILRADTSGAVADVLDELAALAEEGPITAEMLRTMAAARRGL